MNEGHVPEFILIDRYAYGSLIDNCNCIKYFLVFRLKIRDEITSVVAYIFISAMLKKHAAGVLNCSIYCKYMSEEM